MRKVDLSRWQIYFDLRNDGHSVEKAARGAKIDPKTAWRFERGEPGSTGLEAAEELGITTVGGLEVAPEVPVEAQRALSDFGAFRRRYFGRHSTPWQERAAYVVLEKLETPDREYGVINCPPGSGKSTLFTHDIPAWLIARNRGIRCLLGSRTERQARMYVNRLKRTLERDIPMTVDLDLKTKGFAFDAESTMSADYGSFKPPGRTDLWRADALVVNQFGMYLSDDKEPTASAYGADSGFLGGRFDFVVWDDLVDKRNLGGDSRDKLIEAWTTEYETRLEPGGLLILQGQRMGPEDLYRFCLDLTDLEGNRKYFHVLYPSHDQTKCKGLHSYSARPWPTGCLLDPRRIPWRMLSTTQANTPRVFEIQYQQNDGASSGELVQMSWLNGGTDMQGRTVVGCKDHDRRFGESAVPPNIGWSLVSVDPSPTRFWGVTWWVMDPLSSTYELVEGYKRRMGSQDLLSEDYDSREFSGLLEEIRVRSHQIGHPLAGVVVEINAAQKYLLSQPHMQRWALVHDITLIPHITSPMTKTTSEHNVTSISDFFRQGKVRLPYADIEARTFVNNLARELVTWPDGQTDDLVMSTWFAIRAVQFTYADPRLPVPKFERPEYLRRERGMVRPFAEPELPLRVHYAQR
jgi:hypothetical protein